MENVEQRAEKAAELKQFYGYNCAQAVSAVLSDQTDLDENTLNRLTAGFCVGMGNMEATCGSLVAAVMIAGLATEGRATVRYAKRISEAFAAKCGDVTCKKLKGIDTGRVLCPCDECVMNAVRAYSEVMGLV